MRSSSVALLPSLLLACHLQAAPHIKGEFAVKNPAFLTILNSPDTDTQELLISSFGVSGGDSVYRLPLNSSSLQDISTWKPLTLTSKLTWPNEVTHVPESIFGPGYLSIGTGFLVPGRSTGSIQVVHHTSGESITLSHQKDGYFYHRVLWQDMNRDGRLDAVTARGKKPIFGSSDGELLWLEQPVEPRSPWPEHIIAKGPDVNFLVDDLDQDGSPEIIATEFFAKKLSLHWQDKGEWRSRSLDVSLGAAFDLELSDLNGDGRRDLLVSNHEGSASAAIYAYEIPHDVRTGDWTRHTLLTGIKTEKSGMNQASPGSAFALQPNTQKLLPKPWIVAGGDGSTKLHALIPNSDEAEDWTYRELVLLDTDSTIGRLASFDLDGDGKLELFVPAYDSNKVYVLGLD